MPSATRKPTYGAATRLARLVYELQTRPNGWEIPHALAELGVSERTLLRYLAASRSSLVDARGNPLIVIERSGERRVLRLGRAPLPTETGTFDALFVYLATSVLQFLEGTVIKEGMDGLWDRLRRTVPRVGQLRVESFPLKFFTVQHAVKDYRDYDDVLDVAIQCLVYQHRSRILYRSAQGEENVHLFDPYTLALYRGGLYLIGRSDRLRKVIWLAVERVREIERLPARFAYPRDYTPQKYTEGMFGIFDGPETAVEIVIRNEQTVGYLTSRRLHPTQKFRRRRDGATVLSMTVRGTTELLPWILGLTPYVEVTKPAALRRQVEEALAEGLATYGKATSQP